VIVAACVVYSAQAQSLDSCLSNAAANNPGLNAKFNEYYAALEKVPQARALPDPKVMFGYYILPVETRVGAKVFDVQLTQTFPWFGTLAARESEAARWAAAKQQEFLVEKNMLFYEVKTAWYQLWFTQRSITTYHKYLEILALSEESALFKLEAAAGSMVDILRIQMEQKEITAQLEWLQDSKITWTAQLNTFMGHPVDSQIAVPDNISLIAVSQSESAMLDSIMANNPQVKQVRESIQALELQKTIARKAGLPNFGAGINYAAISKRTDPSVQKNGQDVLMPMVTLSLPIYRRKYKALVKEVDYKLLAMQDELADTKNQLAADFVQSMNQYRDAERKVALYTELQEQAGQTLELLTIAYMAATEDYQEVLRMQQQLLKYQLQLEQARASQNTAVASLQMLLAEGIN